MNISGKPHLTPALKRKPHHQALALPPRSAIRRSRTSSEIHLRTHHAPQLPRHLLALRKVSLLQKKRVRPP